MVSTSRGALNILTRILTTRSSRRVQEEKDPILYIGRSPV